MMKTCIYGAGAIGGWIGARLAQAGQPISVVARGTTLAALRTHGLRLREAGRDTAWPVQCSDDPAQLGVHDLVIVAVKAPSLHEVAQRIAPLIGPHTTVLTAMNGVPWWFLHGLGGPFADQPLASVDATGDIARAIPVAQVVGCVVHASCALAGAGSVHHHLGNRLIVGAPTDAGQPRAQAVAALLAEAGFDAPLSPRIQRDVWYKLWGNMTVNPISALTGATTDRILDDPLVRDFVSRVMLEARAIGDLIGVPIAQQPEDRHVVTRQLGAFKTSMLQDAEAGRAVELDALVGAVRELGGLCGIDAPFTDALLGLARLHARVHGLYPPALPVPDPVPLSAADPVRTALPTSAP